MAQTHRIHVPLGSARERMLPTLSHSERREMEAHARGSKQRVSFTVSSHDPSLRREPNRLHIPLPSMIANKSLARLLLSEFESPAITESVGDNTIIAFQSPVTLTERLTLVVKVTDTAGSTSTTATVSMPPTLCPMTHEGGGVFAPTDGGAHGLSVNGCSRCLVNTDVRGDGAVVASGGSATSVQLATGTPSVTSNVFLFTAPRTAVDMVDAMLRRACEVSSTTLGVQVIPNTDGQIMLFRKASTTIQTVKFEWGSPTACAQLGITTNFTVPVGNQENAIRVPTGRTSLQLPQGNGTTSLVAASLSAATGLELDQPLANAATVVNSFGAAVSITWPAGSFSVQTAAATFNALVDAALEGALTGTTSFVHATVSSSSAQQLRVDFASTDGGGFQVTFASDALANLFGFATPRLVSRGGSLTSSLALPTTRLHLHTVLNARSNHLEVTPRLQGMVRADNLASGLVPTQVYRGGAWASAHHRFQVGDVVEVRTHTDASPFILRVSAVGDSTLQTDAPVGVDLSGTCGVQPALAEAQSTLRWLFGATTLGSTQTSGSRLLGLNPILSFSEQLFSGGALPLRADAHPPSDLLITLENAGSLNAKPTRLVRALNGTMKPVLASVTIDRMTSHMETRTVEQGMVVSGKTGEICIGLCDAASLRPSPLLSMDLRFTFTVVLA